MGVFFRREEGSVCPARESEPGVILDLWGKSYPLALPGASDRNLQAVPLPAGRAVSGRKGAGWAASGLDATPGGWTGWQQARRVGPRQRAHAPQKPFRWSQGSPSLVLEAWGRGNLDVIFCGPGRRTFYVVFLLLATSLGRARDRSCQ